MTRSSFRRRRTRERTVRSHERRKGVRNEDYGTGENRDNGESQLRFLRYLLFTILRVLRASA